MNGVSRKLRGSLFLLGAAMIWGCAFTAQSVAADSIGPWTFNGIRFLLGGAEILFLAKPLERWLALPKRNNHRGIVKTGILCGVILIIASVLQQAGIRWTTAGKAGFITSLYVVLVPVFAAVFLRRKVKLHIWISAVLAVIALYLLSGAENGAIGAGELLELLCACAFAVHILVIDHVVKDLDPIRFSGIQFLSAGVLGMLGAVLFERIDPAGIRKAAVPILYAGLMSAGLGYTLQAIGQKDADPAAASVLLSLESVFSAVFGFLLLHEVLSVRELCGCALMFAAVLLSQRQ